MLGDFFGVLHCVQDDGTDWQRQTAMLTATAMSTARAKGKAGPPPSAKDDNKKTRRMTTGKGEGDYKRRKMTTGKTRW
jgi:hypothetical protein